MKKTMALVIAMAILCGCAGHIPKLTDAYQYGDDKKQCSELQQEIAGLEAKCFERNMHRLGKLSSNTVLAIFGFVIFPPVMFMIDAKSDEMAEIDSLLVRRQNLARFAAGCDWCSGRDFTPDTFKHVNNFKIKTAAASAGPGGMAE